MAQLEDKKNLKKIDQEKNFLRNFVQIFMFIAESTRPLAPAAECH